MIQRTFRTVRIRETGQCENARSTLRSRSVRKDSHSSTKPDGSESTNGAKDFRRSGFVLRRTVLKVPMIQKTFDCLVTRFVFRVSRFAELYKVGQLEKFFTRIRTAFSNDPTSRNFLNWSVV